MTANLDSKVLVVMDSKVVVFHDYGFFDSRADWRVARASGCLVIESLGYETVSPRPQLDALLTVMWLQHMAKIVL